MQNPLEQFFPVENRPDGLYIKVDRQQRGTVNLNSIIVNLELAGIMNLDIDKLKDVVQRARGVFEKIGPPFEYYDPAIEDYLQVNVSLLKASLKVSSACLIAGKKLNPVILHHYLKRNKVTTGIETDLLKELLEHEKFNKFVDVAFGVQPIKGVDARIEFKFETNHVVRPQLRNDGSVDYRNIQKFIMVNAGQVLAEKFPAQPGKAGKSVTGEDLPAESGVDVQFPEGKNTEISKDGRYLLSLKTGVLFQENENYSIKELLQVENDVDFSVGNLKYTGDILIEGNVLPGFTVEADGNIHIKGVLEASRVISRNGHVLIDKGIIGKGTAQVKAKQGIQVCFAQDAFLETEGALVVEKSLLHCDCLCKSLEMNGAHSNVVSSRIKAETHMVIRIVGNEHDASTSRLHLFDKNKDLLERKIKELKELESKLIVELEPIQKQLRTKAALLKKSSEDLPGRIRDEIKKWIVSYNELNQKINYVKKKEAELQLELEKPKIYHGFIKITNTLFPAAEIDLYGMKLFVNDIRTGKNYHLNEKGLIEHEE